MTLMPLEGRSVFDVWGFGDLSCFRGLNIVRCYLWHDLFLFLSFSAFVFYLYHFTSLHFTF